MYAIVANCHFNGLAIIQELGRNGVKVKAFDCVRNVGTSSKYAQFVRCPNPLSNVDQFIDFLLAYGARQIERGIIFPTNDQWAYALSDNSDVLSEYFELVVSPISTIELCIKKYVFGRWAQAQSYPVPKTWNEKDLKAIQPSNFPVVAKPEYRRIATNDESLLLTAKYLDANRFHIIRDQFELNQFIFNHQKYLNLYVFQQYVRGLSDCMFTVGVYANKNSEIVAIFSGRKVRGFPPTHGDCIIGQFEAVPDDIITLVRNIVYDLSFTGIGEFEFKRDSVSGTFFLIEINPRSWSWIGITPYCGVSLPLIAYNDLSGIQSPKITKVTIQDGSVKFVKILQDFENCLWNNKRLGYDHWSYTFQDWLCTLKSDVLVIAEFQSDDLLPTFFSIWHYLKSKFLHVFKKVGYFVRSKK